MSVTRSSAVAGVFEMARTDWEQRCMEVQLNNGQAEVWNHAFVCAAAALAELDSLAGPMLLTYRPYLYSERRLSELLE